MHILAKIIENNYDFSFMQDGLQRNSNLSRKIVMTLSNHISGHLAAQTK